MQPQDVKAIDISPIIGRYPDFRDALVRGAGRDPADGWRIALVPGLRAEDRGTVAQFVVIDRHANECSLRRVNLLLPEIPPRLWSELSEILPGVNRLEGTPGLDAETFKRFAGAIDIFPSTTVVLDAIEDMSELQRHLSGAGGDAERSVIVPPAGLPVELRTTLEGIYLPHWEWKDAFSYLAQFCDEVLIAQRLEEYQRDGRPASLGSKVFVHGLTDDRLGRPGRLVLLSAMQPFEESYRLRSPAAMSAMLVHSAALRELLQKTHDGSVNEGVLHNFEARNVYASIRQSEALQALESELEARQGAAAELREVRDLLRARGRFKKAPPLEQIVRGLYRREDGDDAAD